MDVVGVLVVTFFFDIWIFTNSLFDWRESAALYWGFTWCIRSGANQNLSPTNAAWVHLQLHLAFFFTRWKYTFKNSDIFLPTIRSMRWNALIRGVTATSHSFHWRSNKNERTIVKIGIFFFLPFILFLFWRQTKLIWSTTTTTMSESSSIFQTCSGTHDLEDDLAGFIECLSDQHEAVSKQQ